MPKTIRPIPFVEIVDLLAEVPAEGAIFTTFTLSLAWFEVYLLRHLERNGARRIAVLADPTGIQHSLREGLASGPGLRYALEPVRLPRGFFHPKVAIVWGRGKVAIAVGSGNLTMWGMQRNLEVWDVLLGGYTDAPPAHQLTRAPAEGALEFLTQLSGMLDEGAWSRRVIADGASALRDLAPKLPEGSGIQWLDTFRGSIGDQVVQAAGPSGGERSLQVLSPFHHPEGASVRDLAERLEAGSLDLLFAESTSFPIAKARRWPELEFRTLQLAEHERPLHAKVLHIEEPGRSILVSGSANATNQALWTTHNVEVCLLREADKGAFDALLRATPAEPSQSEADRFHGEQAPLAVEWARASSDEVLVKLSWRGSAPSRVELAYVEGDDEPMELAWPSEPVVLHLPSGFDPLRPMPTRIEAVVVVDGVRSVARAWVSFEGWLEASPQWRRTVVAWSRLLRNESGAADEEDAALLRMFGEEHSQAMALLGSSRFAKRGGPSGSGRRRSDLPVPVALLEAASSMDWDDRTGNAGGTGVSGNQIDAVTAAMLQAFRVLDRVDREDVGDEGVRADGSTTEKQQRHGLPRAVRDALEDFEDKFVAACRGLTARPERPAQVLAYAGLCARLALRYRLRDEDGREGAWQTIDRMVRAVLGQRREGPPVLSLLKHSDERPSDEVLAQYAAMVALLHWRARGGRLEGESSALHHRHLQGEGLREALATLERFLSGAGMQPALPALLGDVFPESAEVLDDALAELVGLEAPSSHVVWLRWCVYRLHKGDHTLAELAGMARERRPPAGFTQDERSMLRALERRRVPKLVLPWVESCPGCRQVLASSVRSKLIGRRPVKCTNTSCSRWLLPSEAT